jgi:hypothetical protein
MAYQSNSSTSHKSEITLSSTGTDPAEWREWWRIEAARTATDRVSLLDASDLALRRLRAEDSSEGCHEPHR